MGDVKTVMLEIGPLTKLTVFESRPQTRDIDMVKAKVKTMALYDSNVHKFLKNSSNWLIQNYSATFKCYVDMSTSDVVRDKMKLRVVIIDSLEYDPFSTFDGQVRVNSQSLGMKDAQDDDSETLKANSPIKEILNEELGENTDENGTKDKMIDDETDMKPPRVYDKRPKKIIVNLQKDLHPRDRQSKEKENETIRRPKDDHEIRDDRESKNNCTKPDSMREENTAAQKLEDRINNMMLKIGNYQHKFENFMNSSESDPEKKTEAAIVKEPRKQQSQISRYDGVAAGECDMDIEPEESATEKKGHSVQKSVPPDARFLSSSRDVPLLGQNGPSESRDLNEDFQSNERNPRGPGFSSSFDSLGPSRNSVLKSARFQPYPNRRMNARAGERSALGGSDELLKRENSSHSKATLQERPLSKAQDSSLPNKWKSSFLEAPKNRFPTSKDEKLMNSNIPLQAPSSKRTSYDDFEGASYLGVEDNLDSEDTQPFTEGDYHERDYSRNRISSRDDSYRSQRYGSGFTGTRSQPGAYHSEDDSGPRDTGLQPYSTSRGGSHSNKSFQRDGSGSPDTRSRPYPASRDTSHPSEASQKAGYGFSDEHSRYDPVSRGGSYPNEDFQRKDSDSVDAGSRSYSSLRKDQYSSEAIQKDGFGSPDTHSRPYPSSKDDPSETRFHPYSSSKESYSSRAFGRGGYDSPEAQSQPDSASRDGSFSSASHGRGGYDPPEAQSQPFSASRDGSFSSASHGREDSNFPIRGSRSYDASRDDGSQSSETQSQYYPTARDGLYSGGTYGRKGSGPTNKSSRFFPASRDASYLPETQSEPYSRVGSYSNEDLRGESSKPLEARLQPYSTSKDGLYPSEDSRRESYGSPDEHRRIYPTSRDESYSKESFERDSSNPLDTSSKHSLSPRNGPGLDKKESSTNLFSRRYQSTPEGSSKQYPSFKGELYPSESYHRDGSQPYPTSRDDAYSRDASERDYAGSSERRYQPYPASKDGPSESSRGKPSSSEDKQYGTSRNGSYPRKSSEKETTDDQPSEVMPYHEQGYPTAKEGGVTQKSETPYPPQASTRSIGKGNAYSKLGGSYPVLRPYPPPIQKSQTSRRQSYSHEGDNFYHSNRNSCGSTEEDTYGSEVYSSSREEQYSYDYSSASSYPPKDDLSYSSREGGYSNTYPSSMHDRYSENRPSLNNPSQRNERYGATEDFPSGDGQTSGFLQRDFRLGPQQGSR